MPIFVFKCADCGDEQEKLVKAGSKEPVFCGVCNLPMLQQVTSANIQFKGTGFYETDFKGK